MVYFNFFAPNFAHTLEIYKIPLKGVLSQKSTKNYIFSTKKVKISFFEKNVGQA